MAQPNSLFLYICIRRYIKILMYQKFFCFLYLKITSISARREAYKGRFCRLEINTTCLGLKSKENVAFFLCVHQL